MDTHAYDILISLLIALVASSGFWLWIDKKQNTKNAQTELLIGIAHDRIMILCMHYLERGWVTQDEYENLKDYLYKPYEKLGGNGTARRLMNDVDQLKIKASKMLDPKTGDTLK